MQLLLPSDPFDQKAVDAAFASEYPVLCDAALECSLFSTLDFDLGVFKPWPALMAGARVL